MADMLPSPPAFDALVAECCRLDERALRGFVREWLASAEFALEEDDYVPAPRPGGACESIRNLRASRGAPRVMLAAHTDVCREHEGERRRPRPVVRTRFEGVRARRALIEASGEVQLGADDRVGVAVLLWVAQRATGPLALCFFTDEEIGLRSAREAPAAWFRGLDLIVGIDRGNAPPEIVTTISGLPLCSEATAQRLASLARESGVPRALVEGRGTDVYALRRRGVAREAVNLSCGWYDSAWTSGAEWVDLGEAYATARYVERLVAA